MRYRSIPHPISNSFFANDRLYVSIASALFVGSPQAEDFRLLREFPRAGRGLRCLQVARSGSLFVAPEGLLLADSLKGLWRSSDGGSSWARVLSLEGLPNPVTCWGFAECADGVLLTGVYTSAPQARQAQIYRSDDDGRSWTLAYSDPLARHVHAIAVDNLSGAIYASIGDDFGVWKTKRVIRSRDGGRVWHEILTQMPQVTEIVPLPGARLFASDWPGGARIFRTTNDETFETVMWDADSLYFWLFGKICGYTGVLKYPGRNPRRHEVLGLSPWE